MRSNRHSAARRSREPGIHNHDTEYGFRACAKRAHPGMTRIEWTRRPDRYSLLPSISDCFQTSACFMPECRLTIALPNKKILGGHHDKSNKCTRPICRSRRRRFQPPQTDQGRGGAGRNGRNHESGLCGDRDAIGPNRRADQFNRSAPPGAVPSSRCATNRLRYLKRSSRIYAWPILCGKDQGSRDFPIGPRCRPISSLPQQKFEKRSRKNHLIHCPAKRSR